MASSSGKYSISGDAQEDKKSVLLVVLVPDCYTLHQNCCVNLKMTEPHLVGLNIVSDCASTIAAINNALLFLSRRNLGLTQGKNNTPTKTGTGPE